MYIFRSITHAAKAAVSAQTAQRSLYSDVRIAHQALVHNLGALAPLADGFDDKGLTGMHITAAEDLLHRGLIAAFCRLHIGAFCRLDAKRICHILLRPEESCRDYKHLTRQLLLAAWHLCHLPSAGLRILLAMEQEMEQKEGSLVLHGVNSEIMEVLEITGFDTILEIV